MAFKFRCMDSYCNFLLEGKINMPGTSTISSMRTLIEGRNSWLWNRLWGILDNL